MRMCWIKGRVPFSYLCGLLLGNSVLAQSYTVDDLYTLNDVFFDPTCVSIGGQAGGATYTTQEHAAVWNGPSVVDLNPAGYFGSEVQGTGGGQQVGLGYLKNNLDNSHALLWTSTPASYVVLDPTGFTDCAALGTNGSQQVGAGNGHALLWNGSATSYVDLNPTAAGYLRSEALGTDGTQQVGVADFGAALWSGTAASFVALAPAGYDGSEAMGVSGKQQVGYGTFAGTNEPHAMLWTGTAASYVDLNPAGFTASEAIATNGTQQVGYGQASQGDVSQGTYAALAWSGTADSFVNLGALLPAQFTSSQAFSIDAQGDVFGYAENSDGSIDSIEWQVTPERGGASLLAIGGFGLLARRRRRNCRILGMN